MRKSRKLNISIFLISFTLIPFLIFFSDFDAFAEPPHDIPPGLEIAVEVQEAYTPNLMDDPDVVGTAVGLDSTGNPVIQVFLANEDVRGIPRTLDGIKVETRVTGKLVAYMGPPPMNGGNDNDNDPTANQTPPIKMGTSGGWRHDLANGFCCGGTLGSLVEDDKGNQFVLSAYHILYADIVDGGNNRTAQPGDPVIQPGLIDVSCNQNNAQNVATLVEDGGSLPDENIDAGIAQVVRGMVDVSGEILSIGTISSDTTFASINQNVKKMGRTTGLSRAKVDALNATVSITYGNECAGGVAFTKEFRGQIITTNRRCKFLDGGDSGSLMVEDVDIDPRAVGLLYAGSSICVPFSIAIANPIGDVLSHYNASMVGN